MPTHNTSPTLSRFRRVLAPLLAVAAFVGCDPADAIPSTAATDAPFQAAARDTVKGDSVVVGHTMGDPAAPIAVVEFSDFGCPYCARFARATLPTVKQEYINQGLVRWRYVPVTFGFPGGELMGAAAECAARQGGTATFWTVHDLLYARQVALRGEDARPRILGWLAELGLDPAALDSCIDDPATRRLLDRNNEASQRWYVRGTPTFVVNGVPMAGAVPIEFFRQVFGTVLDPSGM